MKRDAEDGREKGVGVIVTINKLRNDAWKLPTELLDRAEIQVQAACEARRPLPVACCLLPVLILAGDTSIDEKSNVLLAEGATVLDRINRLKDGSLG